MAVISFDIEEKKYRRFKAELMANDEDLENVMNDLVQLYIEQSLMEESTSGTISRSFSIPLARNRKEKASIEGKAIRKIPKWIERKNIPYKIIRAYLMLAGIELRQAVFLEDLEELCTSGRDESVYVENFKSNFAQMKFDGKKSHGKVFYLEPMATDGSYEVVVLFSEVEDIIRNNMERFLE